MSAKTTTNATARANALARRQEFVQRLQDGNYRALYGEHLNSIFSQAVEQFAELGLSEEIGSLRVVLARLLAEEDDLNRLAMNVARVVSVTLRTVQAHHELTGQSASDILDELSKALDELGGLAPITNPIDHPRKDQQ
ncbi:MAG: hypothetical protein WKF81_00220 [Thermomicrobiales bacterium]